MNEIRRKRESGSLKNWREKDTYTVRQKRL